MNPTVIGGDENDDGPAFGACRGCARTDIRRHLAEHAKLSGLSMANSYFTQLSESEKAHYNLTAKNNDQAVRIEIEHRC